MKKLIEKQNIPSADEIADMADRGEDISGFFRNKGKIKDPVQSIDVDFSIDILRKTDDIANELFAICPYAVADGYADEKTG